MNDLIPLSDEQAKAVTKGLDVASGLGGFLREVFGTVPEDLVGIVGGDWLKVRRAENLANIAARSRQRMRGKAEPVSLTLALPLLRAAADESRPELQELWARLLANAMDPKRTVRLSYIEAVKKFDPLDALVLQKLRDGQNWQPNKRDAFAQQLGVSSNQIEVSFLNLDDAKCLFRKAGDAANPNLSAFGTELLNALE